MGGKEKNADAPQHSTTKQREAVRLRTHTQLTHRPPDASVLVFHAMVPTRAVWPFMVRTRWYFCASHTCTAPLLVPMAMCVPCTQHTAQGTGRRAHGHAPSSGDGVINGVAWRGRSMKSRGFSVARARARANSEGL